MRLTYYPDEPVAGLEFAVTASDFSGTLTLNLLVGGNVVASKGCPDPPCHEAIQLRSNWQGRTLMIVASTTTGEREEQEFIIKGEATGQTSSTPAAPAMMGGG
jgi:hypothetical protein